MPRTPAIVNSVLLVATGITVLFALLFFGSFTLVPKTIENGKAIDRAFLEASEFIEKVSAEDGHVPSSAAFDAWKSGRSNWVKNMDLLSNPSTIPSEVAVRFGSMPPDGYALSVWRGEWTEYFISWRKESTVDSVAGLYASSVGLSLTSALLAVVLWRIRRKLFKAKSHVTQPATNDA
jgi:hypothetical protein